MAMSLHRGAVFGRRLLASSTHGNLPLLASSTVFSNPLLLLPQRHKGSGTPVNMGVMFVPQQEAWLVERMGKFNTILEPGLNFLIPVLDKVCSLNPQKNQIVICSVTISFFAGLGEICTELERDCHRYPWPAGVAFFEKLFLLKQKNLSFIQAISMDNVAINIDGVLYLRVMDPYKVKVDEISEVNSSINTYVAGKLWD